MKKLSIYYGFHLAVNIILLITFRNYINLHLWSLLPVFFAALMFIQILLFKDKTADDTMYSAEIGLTKQEKERQYVYLRHAFLFCIPFEIPLIFFLPSYFKLVGILPYIFAYLMGGIAFRIKFGKEIQERIDKEKKELENQKQQEELGLK